MTRAYQQTRARLRRLYDAAVEAALPAHCLPPHLPDPPKADAGRLVIFAIGKAASTAAAESYYDRNFRHPYQGMALTLWTRCRRAPCRVVRPPPVPDEAGAAASKRLMRG